MTGGPVQGKAAWVSQAGQTGVLFSGSPINLIAGDRGIRPEGLYLRCQAGRGAQVRVSVGAAMGASAARLLSLSPRGAWLSVAGWETVKIEVIGVAGTDVTVSYAWTAQSPIGYDVLFVNTLDATGAAIAVPEGARKLATTPAHAGLTFRTNDTGTDRDQIVATASGVPVDVVGAEYVNVVAGVIATWFLEPL